MKCKPWSAIFCIAISSCFANALSAAIISRDFVAPGDGLLTYDSENGREWLDLVATNGVTIEGIEYLLSPNGMLNGFHLASLDDVKSLALSSGFERIDSNFGGKQDFHVAYDFIDAVSGAFGTGGILGNTWWTSGLVSDSLSSVEFQHVSAIAIQGIEVIPGALTQPLYGGSSGGIWTARSPFNSYPTNPTLGLWLYRSTVVPELISTRLCGATLYLLALRTPRYSKLRRRIRRNCRESTS